MNYEQFDVAYIFVLSSSLQLHIFCTDIMHYLITGPNDLFLGYFHSSFTAFSKLIVLPPCSPPPLESLLTRQKTNLNPSTNLPCRGYVEIKTTFAHRQTGFNFESCTVLKCALYKLQRIFSLPTVLWEARYWNGTKWYQSCKPVSNTQRHTDLVNATGLEHQQEITWLVQTLLMNVLLPASFKLII